MLILIGTLDKIKCTIHPINVHSAVDNLIYKLSKSLLLKRNSPKYFISQAISLWASLSISSTVQPSIQDADAYYASASINLWREFSILYSIMLQRVQYYMKIRTDKLALLRP